MTKILEVDQGNWRTELDEIHTVIHSYLSNELKDVSALDQELYLVKLLLTWLDSFSEEFFKFFHHGFKLTSGYSFEEYPKEVNPDVVFGNLINQVNNDLSVLLNAVDRRLAESSQNKDVRSSIINDILTEASNDAEEVYRQLAPFLDPSTQLLLYLHKSPVVRVIPYAPVVLIGLPVTGGSDNLNARAAIKFGSIPHEFGHHLYWYGRLPSEENEFYERKLLREEIKEKFCNDASLSKYMDDNPAWLDYWSEEIVADIVSTVIYGEMAVELLQNRLLTISNRFYLHDDNQYPIPILRPYISLKVLSRTDAEGAANREQQWTRKLCERGILQKESPQEVREQLNNLDKDKLSIISCEIESNFVEKDALNIVERAAEIIVDILDCGGPVPDTKELTIGERKSAIEIAKQLNLLDEKEYPEGWEEEFEKIVKSKGEVKLSFPSKILIKNSIRLVSFGGWTDGGGIRAGCC